MKTLTKNKKRSLAILGLFTCLALNTNYSQNNLFVDDMNSSNLSSSVEVDSSKIFGDLKKSKKDKDGKPKKYKNDKYSGGETLAEGQTIEKELVDQSTGKIIKIKYEDVSVRKVIVGKTLIGTGGKPTLVIEGRSTDVECDTGDCGKLFIPIAFASEAAIDNLGSIDEILQAVKEKQLPDEDVHKEAVATVTKHLKLQKQIDRCEVELPENVETKSKSTRTVLIELEDSKKIDNIKTVSLSGDEKTKCLIENMALIEGSDERAREKFLETIFVQISDDIRDGSPEDIQDAIDLLDEAYDVDYLTSKDRRNLKSLKSAGRTNIKIIDEQERFEDDKERLITGYNDELSDIQTQIDYITQNPQLSNQWEYSQLLNRRYYLEQNFHGEFAQLDRVYKKDIQNLAKSSSRLGQSNKSRRRGRRTRTNDRDEYSTDVKRIHQDITRDIRRIVRTPSKIESLIQKDGGVQLRDPNYSPINDVARKRENTATNTDLATSNSVFSSEFITRANNNPNFSVVSNSNSIWNRDTKCSNGSLNCNVSPSQFPSLGFN